MAKASNQVNKTTAADETVLNYENALRELESIVTQMESGQLPLDEALKAYERGSILLQQCQQHLSIAEQQVRILSDANNLNIYNADD